MSWNIDQCTKYVVSALEKIKLDTSSSFDVGRERAVLLTSWLLRTYYGDNLDEATYESKLLEISNIKNINVLTTLLIERNQDPDIIYQIFSPGTIIITDEMLSAVNNVLSDPNLPYQLDKPIPFFDNISGYDYLTYITALEEPSRSRQLVDLVAAAFCEALSLDPPKKIGDVRQISNGNWKILISAIASSQALNEATFSITHNNHLIRTENDTIPLVCFCPPIDNNVNRIANQKSSVYYIWGISGISLFHRFSYLLKKFGVNSVRNSFTQIFDPDTNRRGAYSSGRAMERLEKYIEESKKKSS